MRNHKNFQGQRFGWLTVLRHLASGHCACVCECGQTINVTASELKQRIRTNCGCLQREEAKIKFLDILHFVPSPIPKDNQ